jgi:hypothetical protein
VRNAHRTGVAPAILAEAGDSEASMIPMGLQPPQIGVDLLRRNVARVVLRRARWPRDRRAGPAFGRSEAARGRRVQQRAASGGMTVAILDS